MSSWRNEINSQARLALPIVVVQVGLMAMGVVDSLMVGRYSTADLAGVALGHIHTFFIMAFGMGLLMGLDPLVAQAFGARDEPGIARALQRGVVLAAVLSVPTGALFLLAGPAYRALGQPGSVVPIATGYAHVSIAGVLPFFLFIVLRQTLQGMHRVRDVVLVAVAGNLANVGLNWVLVFGHLGAPAMGAVGSAWATVACRWAMALGLLAAAWQPLRPYLLPWRADVLDRPALLRLIRLSTPIGVQFSLEIGAFATMGLLMGRLGDEALAAHQVTMNLASLTFMVPLGISAAAAVRVGHGIGRGDEVAVRRAAAIALVAGPGFMALAAAAFVAWPLELASLYIPGQDRALAVAALLIPIAGAFQVFDGTQVVASGVLRGAGDTRWPMLVHVTGFWLLGVPLGWWLGFRLGGGATGPWWGMAAALGLVAVALLLRARWRLAGRLGRVQIDAAAEPRAVAVGAAPEPAAGAPAGPGERAASGRDGAPAPALGDSGSTPQRP